ncbi:MAG: Asp-tRNA(Asn)/Glu-tRNA(Gln) amidotransferase subunit GatC [Candidatus Woesearchaeota archaeon]
MKIDKETIRHVAEVARLKLTEQEIDEFLPQLDGVLFAFSKLDEIDVNGVEPSYQPVELKNAMREDKPTDCLSQEEALKNSPATKDGYFKGPRAV